MSENKTELDLMGALDVLVDITTTNNLKEAAAKTNDPFVMGAIEIFIEYGITGRRLAEFLQKLDALMKIKDTLPNKGGDT